MTPDRRDLMIDDLVWAYDHPRRPQADTIVADARLYLEEWHRQRQMHDGLFAPRHLAATPWIRGNP